MYSLGQHVDHFVGGPKRLYYSFSPVFLAKRMVREERDFGETLQEQVNMTHRHFYEDSVYSFEASNRFVPRNHHFLKFSC
jgi:hypothetical protein